MTGFRCLMCVYALLSIGILTDDTVSRDVFYICQSILYVGVFTFMAIKNE